MTDYNSQLDGERNYKKIIRNYPVDKRINCNRKRFLSVCENQNLQVMSTNFCHEPRKTDHLEISCSKRHRVPSSRKESPKIMNFKANKCINVASDHYISITELKRIPTNIRTTTKTLHTLTMINCENCSWSFKKK